MKVEVKIMRKDTLEQLGFNKIEIEQPTKGRISVPQVRLNKTDKNGPFNKIYLNSALCKLVNWEPGTKVDLYSLGSTFAFKPSTAGCLNICKNKNANVLIINSLNACLEIRSKVHNNKDTFEAWVDEGIMFFK